MGEILAWIGGIGALLVAGAALVLNVLYIRLAFKQISNADNESQRLSLEIEKLKVETLRLHKLIEGDSMVR